jgi:SMODS-associating 4TM effector domain
MPTFPSSTPNMTEIGVAQDNDRNLRRQEAKDHFYTVGNRYHFWGSAVAILLALASPFVLIYKPEWGPQLGAIAGVWIFASRLLLEPMKQRYQTKGAVAQELFDCDVLGIPWNDALIGQLSEEEIRSASKKFNSSRSKKKHKEWYPADSKMSWPKSVLTCQRSNAVWARRQHYSYGQFLIIASGVWVVVGIGISLQQNASLSQYLTTIALPSLPAVLDSIELAKKHLDASSRRKHLEDETNSLFDSNGVSEEDLREIQDQVFELRRQAPPVAGWFYWALSHRYEEDMRYAASERSQD